MNALADLQDIKAKPARRARAAKTVDKALRGGILAGAAAAIGWLLASALATTALFVLVILTVVAGLYTVARGDKARLAVWGLLAVGWVLMIAERWAVHGHGGLWVAAAAWLGVIYGARRAGITKRWMPVLLYPVALGVIVALTNHSLLSPWGMSWIWVAAVLGPVLGVRTLLNPSPRKQQPSQRPTAPDPLADL